MKAIDTGFGIPAIKALGRLYPQERRIIDDPISEKILSGYNKYYIKLMSFPRIFNFIIKYYEKNYPGVIGYQLCRYRYIDDLIKERLAKKKFKAFVNLGAGMDLRAYYISEMKDIPCYEVDHPQVIEKKKKILTKKLGNFPEQVTYVPVDFETDDLAGELQRAGYDLNTKTLFIWEGVLSYLTPDAYEKVFKYVSLAAKGSLFAFSYATRNFVTGENLESDVMKKMSKAMTKKYKLVISGLEPAGIEEYLSKYSLKVLEHIGAKEYKERYADRFNTGLDVCELERMVLTEVK